MDKKIIHKLRRFFVTKIVVGSQAKRLHPRNANISPGVSSDSQAERLHLRIAGVSPSCGCTQPLMREVDIWASLKIHFCP
ncbi:MAG: hypothetical protein LBP59_16455 [Planctomycetaceae bacterium]|nr:hypothetical protein [Planctomycetaceae bacterium]